MAYRTTSRPNSRTSSRSGLSSAALVHVTSTLEHDSSHVGFSTREKLRAFTEAWLNSFASANTQEAYRRDFEQFLRWLDEGQGAMSLGYLNRSDLDEYARFLDGYREARQGPNRTGRPYSPATKARKLAAVSSFYEYALDEGRLIVSPMARVKRPKAPRKSTRNSLSKEQAQRLVEVALEAPANRRAVVALCLGCGLRISEALSLTAENLGSRDGHRVVNVLGKGDKVRTVPLSPLAYRLLEPALKAATADDGLLVRTDDGQPVNRKQASKWLETLGRRAGLEFRLVPHALRHSAATIAAKAGADVERVRIMLGHSDLSTTLRYVHVEELDGSAAYVLGEALA